LKMKLFFQSADEHWTTSSALKFWLLRGKWVVAVAQQRAQSRW
jgi:hypothetical protein